MKRTHQEIQKDEEKDAVENLVPKLDAVGSDEEAQPYPHTTAESYWSERSDKWMETVAKERSETPPNLEPLQSLTG